MGRAVHGASCPWGELSTSELSVGRAVHGTSCLWGELSMVRAVHGANCPWGELSMGRAVHGASSRGASSRGASCHGASLDGASFDGASCGNRLDTACVVSAVSQTVQMLVGTISELSRQDSIRGVSDTADTGSALSETL
jgi:hypothetical protein